MDMKKDRPPPRFTARVALDGQWSRVPVDIHCLDRELAFDALHALIINSYDVNKSTVIWIVITDR